MLKIENTHIDNIVRAVYSARNAMNSWDKSDSNWETDTLGENDLTLAKRLSKAGSDHRKYLRMINVTCDITAPLYWIAEHDTYKVGTVRNSCSFMHKGTSKPFEIRDFSVSDERIYDVLSPLPKKEYVLKYVYDTDEYRIYTTKNGRDYKIFKNGKVVRCAFSYTDNWGRGRERIFEEKEISPSITTNGYYTLNIGGRCGEKWLLHRLIGEVWLENPNGYKTINHINGDKGNNSVENLEWISLEDNIKKGFENGLYDNIKSLHSKYIRWKNGSDSTPKDIWNNENYELFSLCLMWENLLNTLNSLRQEYLDTKDECVFQMIRQLLPQGYNMRYTWSSNYEVLLNIYHSRKNHRLPEWHTFCDWVETLPYFREICLED